MKLIDILIERNIQWPYGMVGVVQDFDGEVKFYDGETPRLITGAWCKGGVIYGMFFTETASDYNTAIITKQEWESKI